MSVLSVAVCSWRVEPLGQFSSFAIKLEHACLHSRHADLLVLPENISFDLLDQEIPEREVPARIAHYAEQYEAQVRQCAREFGMIILGGTTYRETKSGIVNSGLLAHPDGSAVWIDKCKLTQYEVDPLGLAPGKFVPDQGQVGALVCYDSEFPEAGRALCENGALVLAVPAYTETRRGFQRVRWCCQARATENQVFVLHASLVGSLGFEPCTTTYGTSAILAPSVEPFPESAVLAETEPNQPGIVFADLEFGLLEQARSEGDVRNWADRDPSVWNG